MGDNQQYLSYFAQISNSELLQTLSIPDVISKEIAEYSTGTIKECEACKIEFNVLNKECVDYHTKGIKKLSHCSKTNKFFCELCSEKTIDFICCGTVQCIKNYSKCTFIDDKENGHCHDDIEDQTLMAYKCKYCETENDDKCGDCGEWHCDFHQYSMLSYCRRCDAVSCENAYKGLTCEECFEFLCDSCFHKDCKQKNNDSNWQICEVGCHITLCCHCWDGVTCKGCNCDYCDYCYQIWQNMPGRAEHEKHCKICNGYFCARHGCCNSVIDDICAECQKKKERAKVMQRSNKNYATYLK